MKLHDLQPAPDVVRETPARASDESGVALDDDAVESDFTVRKRAVECFVNLEILSANLNGFREIFVV